MTTPGLRPVASPITVTRGSDQADISPTARTLASIASLPDPRPSKVADIRAQLEAGTYDTGAAFDAKLDAAIDEIIREVDAGL